MLESLRVKNLAVVEDLRVEFERGLNVITGETGAGKSVLAGALALILGERADKTLIRAGGEQCCVEAAFLLSDPAGIDEVLDEAGLDPCEEGRLLIRRVIATAGGKVLVNDSQATVSLLKQLGERLVDMHGPHDHQSLLRPEYQIDLLDAFGHLWEAREGYEQAYRHVLALRGRRRELEGSDDELARELDLLTYQVNEIEAAAPEEGEDETLAQEHQAVANAARIGELAGAALDALNEGENSLFDGFASVQNALEELSRILSEATAWKEEAASIAVQIQELAGSIGSTVHGLEADPARLEWLEDRMALLHKLKRKYGGDIASVLEHLARTKTRVEELESRSERLAALDRELEAAGRNLQQAGQRLTAERTRTAKALGRAVTAELKALGFPHGAFSVTVEPCEPGPRGMDAAEFGFAPNPGEPMRPLRLIASSGEISRVMLATKAVLAMHDRIPVMVFDEIDANLGGEMGNAVGAKLAAVAGTHQVLCITHLPQVAVHGSTHFVVTKAVQGGRTRTYIEKLGADDRAAEIARMLGGKDITSVVLRHASEMLRREAAADR